MDGGTSGDAHDGAETRGERTEAGTEAAEIGAGRAETAVDGAETGADGAETGADGVEAGASGTEAGADGATRRARGAGRPIDRRSLLALGGVAVAGTVAGCLDGDGDGDDGQDEATDDGADQSPVDDGAGTEGDDDSADDGSADDGDDGSQTGDDQSGEDDGTADGGDDGGHELPFEDDLEDVDALHESSDDGALGFDTTNTDQFARPDEVEEATDPSRLNRTTASDAAVVYSFAGEIGGFRAEVHRHSGEEGECSVAVSGDGEEWTEIDVEPTLYSEAHGDEEEPGAWWENYEYAGDVDEDASMLRFTLSGEPEWTPQLGHVEVW